MAEGDDGRARIASWRRLWRPKKRKRRDTSMGSEKSGVVVGIVVGGGWACR
jgi:hypothetical protein